MKPEETIDFHIRWAWHRIARYYNAQAARHGSTMAVGYALLNIDGEGTPSTQLGPKMGMEPRSLTRTLKAMEKKGLIVRRSDKRDKRMVRIFLTSKGLKKREIAKKVVLGLNQALQQALPQKKLSAFFEVMGDINFLLNENGSVQKPVSS